MEKKEEEKVNVVVRKEPAKVESKQTAVIGPHPDVEPEIEEPEPLNTELDELDEVAIRFIQGLLANPAKDSNHENTVRHGYEAAVKFYEVREKFRNG
jgi:hypothetical protein